MNVRTELRRIVSHYLRMKESYITDDTDVFGKGLLDSLDAASIVFEIEEFAGVDLYVDGFNKASTFGEIVAVVEAALTEKL
jgi:acyl carrier protein